MPAKKQPITRGAKTVKAKAPARRSTAGRTNGSVVDAPATNGRRARSGRDLVIVDSPAKARTIAAILGPNFEITASVGHVRDLPKSKLGVDIEHEFAPEYLVPKEKREVVNHIREAAARANTVYLATDPDREGEAISWHLVEAA